jgi:hypothetical protein
VTQIAFGPVNIVSGNSAQFVVEFLDVNGNLTIPSSGYVAVAYTNTSNATQTDLVSLSQVNDYFLGTWSSTSASLGIATWTLAVIGSTSIQQTGVIRVITPGS